MQNHSLKFIEERIALSEEKVRFSPNLFLLLVKSRAIKALKGRKGTEFNAKPLKGESQSHIPWIRRFNKKVKCLMEANKE